MKRKQPPSGGCELKPCRRTAQPAELSQPPSGGCELKPVDRHGRMCLYGQPPSGGCELKLYLDPGDAA